MLFRSPHKVNPIDFENAEGNLGISNSLLEHFRAKLPISRLQRDLSDSTVLRNIGLAFGHSYLALTSLLKGLNKLSADKDLMLNELREHPELLAEAYQSLLRFKEVPKAYETLKDKTRGKKIQLSDLHDMLDELKISEEDKKKLKELKPENYLGYAKELTQDIKNWK